MQETMLQINITKYLKILIFSYFLICMQLSWGESMQDQNIIKMNQNIDEATLPSSGWELLFNGRNVDDWSFVGFGDFVVEDGALKSRGKTGLLWYKRKKFGNCVVRVVYKVSNPQTCSAVLVNIPHPPSDVWDAVNHAYQIKIMDDTDAYHRTGSVYSLSPARLADTKPPGQWNTLDIFLKEAEVTVYVNGKKVSHYNITDAVPERTASSEPERGPRSSMGYIGIQNHNDLINEVVGQIWFKEIKVLPLA
jgi:hypothetical protein